MAVFRKMFKKFLGFEEEDFKEEDMYEEFAEEEAIVHDDKLKNTPLELNKTEEITLYPKVFGDACEVVEQLEQGNIVTINMNDVDIDTCKRITDFVLGAIYVLNGDVEKLSKKVFRFWITQ